ncbi:MAG: PTS transporter subunit EIIC [Erysipelotrichaceae bacterium]|nr:PTS transporter subunit EIIC [Erysipelotrichaceae bacterium]
MAKQNYEELSQNILTQVGGKENISRAYHCMTRLRLDIKDKGLVNIDELEKVSGIVGTQWNGNQLQIIIGQQVDDVYVDFCKVSGLAEETKIDENLDEGKKKFSIQSLFQTMSAILLPVVPALAGGGMIKGLITILTSYCGIDEASTAIVVMTMAGDCVFYFLPFLVAWSASRRFKTDTALAIAMAGVLLYPTMTSGYTDGLSAMSFFGLPIPFVRYYGSTIPIILTVWVLSYVYKWINNLIPKSLRIVFVPTLVLAIMTPLALIVIGPLATYISQALVYVFNFLYGLSPMIAGAIVGGTRLFVVMTGMHLSLSTIALGNIAEMGYDWLLPMNTMGTLALFGACFGVWLKAKNSENKQIGASTAISSFIGITEPGIYGIFLKFRTAMIATIAGGAVGGAIVGLFGGRATAYVNSCILSTPVFMTDNFWCVALGMAVSAIIAFAIVMVLGLKEDEPAEQNN